MKFRCLLSSREHFYSPSGDVSLTEYTKCSSNGVCILKKTGTKNIKFLVQESAKGHLLCDLIKRARVGDVNAITPVDSSMFGDSSNMPSDLLSAANLSLKVNQLFDSLPLDVRNRYGNNSYNFMKAVSENSQDLANMVAASQIHADKVQKDSNTKSLADAINKLIGGNSDAGNS